MEVQIENKILNIKFDTEASTSVCSEDFFKENFASRKLEEAHVNLRIVGTKFKVKGQVGVKVQYDNRIHTLIDFETLRFI